MSSKNVRKLGSNFVSIALALIAIVVFFQNCSEIKFKKAQVADGASTALDDNSETAIGSEPIITDVTVFEGQPLQVILQEVTIVQDARYVWYLNDQILAETAQPEYFKGASELGDMGQYRVVIFDSTLSTNYGTATGFVTVIAVDQSAPPIINTQPQALSVQEGQSLTLTVEAVGSPDPSYQWMKDGVAINGATAATYTLPTAAVADSGSYTVQVFNTEGSISSDAAAVTVTALVCTFTANGGTQTLSPGQSLTESCNVTVNCSAFPSGGNVTFPGSQRVHRCLSNADYIVTNDACSRTVRCPDQFQGP